MRKLRELKTKNICEKMTNLSIALMIDYINGNVSEEQSSAIESYLKKHPYYEDILKGLTIELEELLEKEKVLNHLKKEKEQTITLLSSTKNC